jgi:chlorophyllide a reductase subunit Z
MGYSGACWLIQEVCNALFDMLFEILPMASELDAIEATAAKANSQMPWHPDAQAALERRVNQEPVLVRISAAKRLRERAEQRARQNKASEVTLDDLEQVSGREGAPA